MRAKPSSRRYRRPFRALHVEPLEKRALLSGGGFVDAASVAGADPPPVITFVAANTISDVWDLEGTVTDNGKPVAGLKVEFGGVLSKYGLTGTVEADGTYSVTDELRNIARGTATAQTHAQNGKASNVAMDYILNNPASSSVPPSSDPTTDELDTISTIAGLYRYRGDGQTVAEASLNSPQGLAVDSSGNLFIADTCNNAIREVNLVTRAITTIAGSGVCGYQGDHGAATSAELNAPMSIAVDAAGDIFIADTGNDVIREVKSSTGVISTVAGNGTCGYSGDGAAAVSAELDFPKAVAVDSAGNLFIADSGNNVVRAVNLSTGVISTVAGNGTGGYSGDGAAATSARLDDPTGVAADAAGDLFIADSGNNVVREVNLSTGAISTVAGNGTGGYRGDGGAATSAELYDPTGIAVDSAGNCFIADSSNGVVREVNVATGQISTVAGSGTWGYSGDGGAATSAELSDPTAVAVDAAGDFFIGDSLHNAVREVDASTGLIQTVVGNGAGDYSGDGGAATGAELYNPLDVAVDSTGNLFVADSNNNVIREINASTGVISTVAGSGAWGYSGDGGAATSATLYDPMGVALDAAGDLFIADSGNNVVREVNFSTGLISTVAGTGTAGYSGDGGAATSAEINDPTGIAVDAAGDIFIADCGNNVVREVAATGVIATVAGNFDLGSGYGGDGGAATSAAAQRPHGCRGRRRGEPLHRRHVQQRHSRGQPLHRHHQHGRGNRRRGLQRRRRRGHQRHALFPEHDRGGQRGGPVRRRQRKQRDSRGRFRYGRDQHGRGKRHAGPERRRGTGRQRPVQRPRRHRGRCRGQPLHRRCLEQCRPRGRSALVLGPGRDGQGGCGRHRHLDDRQQRQVLVRPVFRHGRGLVQPQRRNLPGHGGHGHLGRHGQPRLGRLRRQRLSRPRRELAYGGRPERQRQHDYQQQLPVHQHLDRLSRHRHCVLRQHSGRRGAVCLNMAGSGTFVAVGDNAYSGGTTVSAGTLVATTAAAVADTALTIGAGGTFIFDPDYTPSESAPAPQGPGKTPSQQGPGRTPRGGSTSGTSAQDIAPVVAGIQCEQVGPDGQVTVGQGLVDADTVLFSVAFNKSVTGVAPSDFTVDGNGAAGTVDAVSGAGCQYSVTVSGITGSGPLGLAILAGNTIADQDGTPLAQTTIAVDQQYTIDRQLYWDPSANAAAGGTATWDTGRNWRVGGPAGPLQGWCDGSDAFLGGTPATISITNPIVVSSITVLCDGYTLEGDAVTLGSPQTVINVAAGSFVVDVEVVGDALVKNGNGALVLGGVNAYACSTTVNGGELQFQNDAGLPAGTALTVNGASVDLGGGADLTTVTLCGGAITDGTLQAGTSFLLYSGTVLADLAGPAALEKLGPGTVVLAGQDTFQGGASALAGTLVVSADGLPNPATGPGTVVVQPTLYWSGDGDWTTGQWQLADGTPTPWLDGASAAIAAGSDISISGPVNVSSITVAGDATIGTIGDGTISFPSWSGTIDVQAGTATFHAAIAGSFAETGPGTLLLDGTLDSATVTVAGGTCDILSPLAAAPVLAGGRAIGPGALFAADNQSLESNRSGHVQPRTGPLRRPDHRSHGHDPDSGKRHKRRCGLRRRAGCDGIPDQPGQRDEITDAR